MIDVISDRNVFEPQFQKFENIRGYIQYFSNSECKIEFKAEYYLEPISRYCVLIDNDIENINITCISDDVRSTGSQKNIKLNNGEIHNALFESVARGTTPSFPYIIKLTTINGEDIKVAGLLRAMDSEQYCPIPYQVK